MGAREELNKLKNPPLVSWFKKRRMMKVIRNMRRLLPQFPNVTMGKNNVFMAYTNIAVVGDDCKVVIGEENFMFAGARITVFEKGELKIGNGAIFAEAQLTCRHKITIGDRFMCGRSTIIEDCEGHPADPTWRAKQVDDMRRRRMDEGLIDEPSSVVMSEKEIAFFEKFPFAGQPPIVGPVVNEIVIGDNVWIGRNATILKGVHIGDNCIVATGSIVTKDVPSNTIVAGVPAKPVKQVEPRDFDEIMDEITAAHG